MILEQGNIFEHPADNKDKEAFQAILKNDSFELESIISQGQRTEQGKWLDEENNEWVVLLSGKARLLFERGNIVRELKPGDYVYIPSHCQHRVEWTAPGEKTVWLALHFKPSGKSRGCGGHGLASGQVKIVRTARRKKTIAARMVDGVLCVFCPRNTPQDFLVRTVEKFKVKFNKQALKKQLNRDKDLRTVASELNRKYFQGKLTVNSIEYVTDQKSKFGCCNYHKKAIRIAHCIAAMPEWVRDYVVVHELAHLLVPDHSRAFWDLVANYKLAERAKGYLLAKGIDHNEESQF
ncbi:MAG: DUF45 domain-containing protein [Candidatus Omnitrophica bacterium]|jgi:quercetin dioxygenase-like cupin family protein|nr:DUF45 domain-containing protein [Candidatus Omnitrophota bacterium]MDD5079555.1 DUF45 domain-containing protein [Candidatus Omnitrophota bacterium]